MSGTMILFKQNSKFFVWNCLELFCWCYFIYILRLPFTLISRQNLICVENLRHSWKSGCGMLLKEKDRQNSKRALVSQRHSICRRMSYIRMPTFLVPRSCDAAILLLLLACLLISFSFLFLYISLLRVRIIFSFHFILLLCSLHFVLLVLTILINFDFMGRYVDVWKWMCAKIHSRNTYIKYESK